MERFSNPLFKVGEGYYILQIFPESSIFNDKAIIYYTHDQVEDEMRKLSKIRLSRPGCIYIAGPSYVY